MLRQTALLCCYETGAKGFSSINISDKTGSYATKSDENLCSRVGECLQRDGTH
jgi:hypothetical protein